jgi:ATP-dependent RNA helicase HelY
VLETSFAQFQADRAVVGLARQARTQEEALEGYAEAMTCHLGDFREYAGLRAAIKERETQLARQRQSGRRAETAQSLERVRVGDVLRVPAGRRSGYVVVVEPDRAVGLDGPKPHVLGADRQIRRLTLADLSGPVDHVTQVRLPRGFNPRSPQSRRDLASTLRAAVPHDPPSTRRSRAAGDGAADDEQLLDLRRRMRAHACHACPQREDHARWGERWARLRKETDSLLRRIEGRTSSVATTFDRVCRVLTELGYLDHRSRVTTDGERLRRLYTEQDLLAAQCLRTGAWAGLDGPGLAAVLTTLVHETRRDDALAPQPPGGAIGQALEDTWREWSRLEALERDHRVSTLREPDAGLAPAMLRWARGQSLDTVLRDSDLAAGDFVRRCKQLVDLLGQVQNAWDDPAGRRAARQAVDGVLRGVVAHSLPG